MAIDERRGGEDDARGGKLGPADYEDDIEMTGPRSAEPFVADRPALA
jgi:hypothetical protein